MVKGKGGGTKLKRRGKDDGRGLRVLVGFLGGLMLQD